MPTITRTENDQVPCGQTLTKLLTADSGKKFSSIKIKRAGEGDVDVVFTNNKEHVLVLPNIDKDAEIVVCQVNDDPMPPSKFKVRVQFNDANAQIQLGFGGTTYDGYGNMGLPRYPTAGIEYTEGQLFVGFVQVKPAVLFWNELFMITVNGTPLPSVVGNGTYLIERLVTQDLFIVIATRPKGSTQSYTVTTSVAGSGSVTPSSQTVNAGGNAFITISPAAGMEVKSVTLGTTPLTAFNKNGGSLNLGAIYSNVNAHVVFGPINTGNQPANNAVINWYIYDRLVGSDTQALQYDRSAYINTNIVERVHKRNGNIIPGFNLPYNYTGDMLRLETTWSVGQTTIDEFLDSLNANYLRLAIQSMGKDGNNLKVNTRLNNSYANAGAGFQASQVRFCRLKVTDPNGTTLNYNHPVLQGITDLMHTIPLTVVGVYTIETETVLQSSSLLTSYSKTFAELSIP